MVESFGAPVDSGGGLGVDGGPLGVFGGRDVTVGYAEGAEAFSCVVLSCMLSVLDRYGRRIPIPPCEKGQNESYLQMRQRLLRKQLTLAQPFKNDSIRSLAVQLDLSIRRAHDR